MVFCIPAEQVKPRADCPDCGKKEAYGHHSRDCINVLKRRLARADSQSKGGAA